MGTLDTAPQIQANFFGQIYQKGLDLGRCVINRDLGTEVANATATFNAGSLVSRDANGFVVAGTGSDTYGIAKWGKTTFGDSVNVDEAIVLTGTTATNLKRANVSDVTVRSAPNMGGTVYADGTSGDFTVNATNGTITRTSGSTITSGATVYVTYVFQLTDADFTFDGRFFQNQDADRTAFQDGSTMNLITVITDWARVFTVEWTPGPATGGGGPNAGYTYAITGANSKLYCSTEGKFYNNGGSAPAADFVGRVYQVPTASDPYMGVVAGGNPMP